MGTGDGEENLSTDFQSLLRRDIKSECPPKKLDAIYALL
jgi:hypothetical protein